MVEVRIYAEGGGEGQLLDTLFRKGWTDFFKAAGLTGRMPRIIRGKGRKRTTDCKTSYAKGRVSFELLSALDPAHVEQRCPHAQRLLTRLRNL